MSSYDYRHTIGFEETNLQGNVYYVNHLRWQGRCREMFLKDHAPDVLDELAGDLRLVTLRVSCEYLGELRAFDELTLRMRLVDRSQNRMTLGFEYVKASSSGGEVVARGEQVLAAMRREASGLVPTPIPAVLDRALSRYA